jgi:hypothetical protein
LIMAHYAFLDENNIVTEVIPGRHEWEVVDGISDWEEWYGNFRGQKCVRTSYNGNIRKQFAGIGFTYNEEADVFVSLSPWESWTLDENFDWQPPIPMPEIPPGGRVLWDEVMQEWRTELG